MGMYGMLCSLSEERRVLLAEDPGLFADVLQQERPVPGLLSLGKAWDALDKMLAAENASACQDAVLAHGGVPFAYASGFGAAKLLEPPQVAEVAEALAALSEDFVNTRYPSLAGQTVHGGYGQPKPDDMTDYEEELAALGLGGEEPEDLAFLREVFTRLVAFYHDAAERGAAVVAVVV